VVAVGGGWWWLVDCLGFSVCVSCSCCFAGVFDNPIPDPSTYPPVHLKEVSGVPICPPKGSLLGVSTCPSVHRFGVFYGMLNNMVFSLFYGKV